MTGWAVVLDGVVLLGTDQDPPDPLLEEQVVGYLSSPPDGLGVPSLRVEDVSYPQRDGIGMFADWYDARVITMENAFITPEGCPECPSARESAKILMETWSRNCGITELVIFTDCHGTDEDRSVVGPFGVRGRPRVAELDWVGQGDKSAEVLLRFDSVDHRLYILDANGTPGSGGACQDLDPAVSANDFSEQVAATGAENYWQLDDPAGSAQAANTATPARPGTYIGAVAYQQQPVIAPLGPSMNGQVGLPTGPTAIRTIGYWSEGYATFTATDGVNTYTFDPTDTIQWGTGTGGTVVSPNSAVTSRANDGKPHFWVIVHTTSPAIQIWCDGQLLQTQSLSGSPPPAAVNVTFRFWAQGKLSDVFMNTSAYGSLGITPLFSAGGGAPQNVTVDGNLCVPAEITFTGPLTNPRVYDQNGNFVGLNITLAGASGGVPAEQVVVDTEVGTATLRGANMPRLIVGDPFFTLQPGVNPLYVTAKAGSGDVNICWRPAVISA